METYARRPRGMSGSYLYLNDFHGCVRLASRASSQHSLRSLQQELGTRPDHRQMEQPGSGRDAVVDWLGESGGARHFPYFRCVCQD